MLAICRLARGEGLALTIQSHVGGRELPGVGGVDFSQSFRIQHTHSQEKCMVGGQEGEKCVTFSPTLVLLAILSFSTES